VLVLLLLVLLLVLLLLVLLLVLLVLLLVLVLLLLLLLLLPGDLCSHHLRNAKKGGLGFRIRSFVRLYVSQMDEEAPKPLRYWYWRDCAYRRIFVQLLRLRSHCLRNAKKTRFKNRRKTGPRFFVGVLVKGFRYET
jgi:hypothetical protein